METGTATPFRVGACLVFPGLKRKGDTTLDKFAHRTSAQDLTEDPLTNRERQVLQLIAEGSTTKEIARELHVSVKTAESHRARIMHKLDIHNVAGLVRYAVREGIIHL